MIWQITPPASLRSRLMLGILVPVVLFLIVNAAVLYRQALRSADTAYDRTLLATAKSIGEQLDVVDDGQGPRLLGSMTYSALEAFEADNRSRLYYRVTGFAGEMVSGFEQLPAWRGQIPMRTVYAALVDFYDDHYENTPVRVAVLLQPVASAKGQGIATIQVAETLELRQTLAQQILVDTLWRQSALIVMIALVVVGVVHHATKPVQHVSQELLNRPDNDLRPLSITDAPSELVPLLDATNQHMARLSQLLEHQKRFVRDASHQLRTPLAVLKTQVQSALRGDVPSHQALYEIGQTVESATELANQMLALAKVEQLRGQTDAPWRDWAEAVRVVTLDLATLVADKHLDFELDTEPVWVRAHDWSLKELARNLLHNAIRHSPVGGELRITLHPVGPDQARLTITDSGPGIADSLRERLFQPFATAPGTHGNSGLGLAICHGIVQALGGRIELTARTDAPGLQASVLLPMGSKPHEQTNT
jgi:two-component system, OmpR family, sensor histidine kinase TctE